jgi:hypothetical protein
VARKSHERSGVEGGVSPERYFEVGRPGWPHQLETHPLKPGGPTVRHANVEVVKPGPKNRPQVVSNEHITQ